MIHKEMPLNLLATITTLFSACLGLVLWRRLNRPLQLVCLQCVLAGVTELFALYLIYVIGGPNTWLYNIYMLLELWIITAVGISLLGYASKPFTISAVAVTVFWICRVYASGLNELATDVLLLNYTLFIFLFTMVLINSGKQPVPFFSMEQVWISVAILLHAAGSIPVMGLLNYTTAASPQLSRDLFAINNWLCIVRYLLMAVSFVILVRKRRNSVSLPTYG